VTDKLIIPK